MKKNTTGSVTRRRVGRRMLSRRKARRTLVRCDFRDEAVEVARSLSGVEARRARFSSMTGPRVSLNRSQTSGREDP